jgi:hypothetical protein
VAGVAESFRGCIAEHLVAALVDDHDAFPRHRERAGQAVPFGGERLGREQRRRDRGAGIS